jgi:hypothetical protein
MDQNDPSQWVDIGRALLPVTGGSPWAERAFRRALRLDASVDGQVAAARAAADERQRRGDEIEKTIEDQRLRTRSPEAQPWPADPWPIDSPTQQVAAVLTLKAEVRQILRGADMQVEPIETDRLLIYGDGDRLEMARLATRLEAIYGDLMSMFGVQGEWNFFWGKAVVLSFGDRDQFQMVEAESFDQLVLPPVAGICHPLGPKVYVNLCRDVPSDALMYAAARELVHGFMHRYRTPRRLPPWAHEGLAEYVAADVVHGAAMTDARRHALGFVRGDGNVNAVLDLTYDDGWPDPANLGAAVGALFVELMISQRPETFRSWVVAVKHGKDWEQALAEDYGVPRPQLIDTVVQYYRVNN